MMPVDHPLALHSEITLNQLIDQPFVALTKGQRWRDRLEEVFAGTGVAPRINPETTSTPVVKQLVREGHGLTIVDRICGRIMAGEPLVLRPLAREQWITYASIHPRGPRQSLAEAFVDAMCAFVENERARDPEIADTVRLI